MATLEESVALLGAVPVFETLGARGPAPRRRGRRPAPLPAPPGHLPRGRRRATRATSSAAATRARCASTPTGARSRSPTSAPATSSASWRCSTTSAARRPSRRSTPVEAVAVAGSDMRRLLREHPDIAVKLVIALGRRLREANERLTRQSFQTVQSRVAVVLGQLVDQARAEGGRRRRRARPHHAGRHRPARRVLARVGQPLPRRARARGRHHAGPRPAHRPRPRRAPAATSTDGASAPESEFSAGGVVVRDGRVRRDRPDAPRRRRRARCSRCPRATRTTASRPPTPRCARCARRPASRPTLVEKLGDVRYWYMRDGRRIAKVVSFFLLEYRRRRARRPRPRGRARALDAARPRRPASSPTRASATWRRGRCHAGENLSRVQARCRS